LASARAIILVIILLTTTFPLTGAVQDQRDDDECGITYSRDDDGSNGGFCVDLISPGDWCIKKLWVYYDDYYYSDEIRLYIYGKMIEQRDTNVLWSHKIYIDGVQAKQFRASSYFNSDTFIWTYFVIDKSFINPNTCVEVRILKNPLVPAGKEALQIGKDCSFVISSTNPDPYQDYGRSWTNLDTGQDPWNDFDGEIMVYFEFVDIDNNKCSGHQSTAGTFVIKLEEERAAPNDDADSCGIELDWSGMTVQEFDSIYKTRIFIRGMAKGQANVALDNIQLTVNGNSISFNPYKTFNSHEYGWVGFEIFNMDDKALWLVRGINSISLHDTDDNNNRNNLWISTEDQDSDDSWWYYYDEGSSQYLGEHEDPSDNDNDKDIQYYVEVYKARTGNEKGSTNFYELGMIIMEDPAYYVPLQHDGIDAMKTDFENGNYETFFDLRDLDPTMWSIYGERRSKYDEGGDLVDILVYYGHGAPEVFQLYYDYLYYDLGYSNGGRINFNSIDRSLCTPAEGNDEGLTDKYMYEDRGSDGFDLDTEWILLYSCSVLAGHVNKEDPGTHGCTNANNDFLTLLYHGLHFIFGFTEDILQSSANDAAAEFFDECWGDVGIPAKSVRTAWEDSCENNNLFTWAYYYHTSNQNDFLWGVDDPGRVTPDVNDKSDIAFEFYS